MGKKKPRSKLARAQANVNGKDHPDFPAFLMQNYLIKANEFHLLTLNQQELAVHEFQNTLPKPEITRKMKTRKNSAATRSASDKRATSAAAHLVCSGCSSSSSSCCCCCCVVLCCAVLCCVVLCCVVCVCVFFFVSFVSSLSERFLDVLFFFTLGSCRMFLCQFQRRAAHPAPATC